MSFRLFTFGGLRLEGPEGLVTGGAAQRRRLALLTLLAVAGERGVSREKAFGYLWPEHPASRARHQLSESLYVLRGALGEDAIAATTDELRLNSAVVWSDVAVFTESAASGAHEAAAGQYRGAFLDGFFLDDAAEFDQWVTAEREQLSRAYTRVLEATAEAHSKRGDAVSAAEWLHRLSAHEPFSARVATKYMQALVDAGDRARALQHASAYTARLRDELGMEPDPDLGRLVERIQRGGEGQRPSVPAAAEAALTLDESLRALAPEFEILNELGSGELARVYLAREPALRRMVAIKVLLPEYAKNETARLRFEREAQAAARIQHPNVVTAFRFGRLGSGAPYIVMPYVAGGSLEDRLAATGALPLSEAQEHIRQLADALAAAHKAGIVHRDVRPANILYDRDTNRLLLTDFGIAAVLESGAQLGMRLTRPGESLGHVAYASPEQLRAETVTERADVYSLGVTAFEMIAGRLPYDATKPTELLVAHATQQPRRLREFVPQADKRLEDLLLRCLNKRPEQRPFASEIPAFT